MAKPKLALIPSAQGSKFYSVLPSSGVGDFDFTRSGSATRINSQGLIETVGNGVSRLNYPLLDGKVVGCPHHILEPQRTNLITYSEDFSNSAWQKNSVGSASAPIVTSNFAISPNGIQNASRVQFEISGSTSSDRSSLETVFALNGSSSYTLSFYIKSNTGLNQNLSVWLNSVYGDSITVTNEWVRVVQTFSSNSTFNRGFGLAASGNIQQSVDVLIYGAQLEQGLYLTSYIPTNGSAVTRSAETATGAGDAATFNDSEGVLMAEISALADDLTNRGIAISDGSVNNRVTMFYTNVSNAIQVKVVVGGSNSLNSYIAISNISLHNKFALKYKQNDFSLFVNGFELITDTSGNTFSNGTLTELAFDRGDGAEDFYGNTKQIQYYDSALTNSELETLTSWVSFQDMAEGQLYTIE